MAGKRARDAGTVRTSFAYTWSGGSESVSEEIHGDDGTAGASNKSTPVS
jgi:hypothetical protein